MAEARTDVERNTLQWLWLSVTLTLLPHSGHFPLWLSALCGLLLLWPALELQKRNVVVKPRSLILLLGLAAGLAVTWEYKQFFGKDSGIALLALLLCLKQLEVRTNRDVYATVLLSYFMQLAVFLYDQSIFIALSCLLALLLATATLASIHMVDTAAKHIFKLAWSLGLQAFPLLLILFIAFPRIEGPLWGLPNDKTAAQTGLSDHMEPGAISELSESNAIAFRVNFKEKIPPPRLRYWRGPVLSYFDGRAWQVPPSRQRAQNSDAPPLLPASYLLQGPAIEYTMTLEAHQSHWLLAMDYPQAIRAEHYVSDNFQLLSRSPVNSRKRFTVTSFPQAQVGTREARNTLTLNLMLPVDSNPRTRGLVERLKAKVATPQGYVKAVVEYLREAQLTYTLYPGRLGQHAVDEFLFDSGRGFCEHFASSFVFMMRAGGIPARVVVGYQGGAVNPLDQTFVVRQSDAHAWAEIWVKDLGWQRVDPTAVAAPRRIEEGLAASLPSDETLPFMLRSSSQWLRDLRNRWEAVSNAWNQWVLGYNSIRQQSFWQSLGLETPSIMTLAVIMTVSVSLLLLVFGVMLSRQRRRRDPLDKAWQKFGRIMADRGIARYAWEGPLAYGRRCAHALPTQANLIKAISQRYALYRYGPPRTHPQRAVASLLQLIRKL